jgi:two-component system, chemotaxis family, protein-glutamate methylesterase/glutaminase
MIKVLIVDDSPVARDYLVHIFNSAPGMHVVGTANNGKEALEEVSRLKPDVVTMDINMPVMDGLEATRRIMETDPVPILIVSGVWDPAEVQTTFKAMEAGAVTILQRPVGLGHPAAEEMAREMTLKVRLMSEVKVVRRRSQPQKKAGPYRDTVQFNGLPQTAAADIGVVAIGASAGGPVVIQSILNAIQGDFPAPILIVQHIATGFLKGMVDWLAETSGISLKIAADGETPIPGHAYFAPDGFNLGIHRDGRMYLDDRDTSYRAKPSVSYLFQSVADAFGRNAVGILLSGMGRDGAAELKQMRVKGAVTMAQDRESSLIFGMPGAAVELDAAAYVLPPGKIIAALKTLARNKENHDRER